MGEIFGCLSKPSENGILVYCADQVTCRIYPFIQDISADMEEM